jgi:hypothetical protein
VSKGKTIHRKQFMGGRVTPQELHSALAFPVGAKCVGCGGPPLTTIRTFAEEAEMLKRDPRLKILCMALTKMGPYLRLAEVYACSRCTPEAERAAAKHPSWCFCDINYGPEALKLVIGPT